MEEKKIFRQLEDLNRKLDINILLNCVRIIGESRTDLIKAKKELLKFVSKYHKPFLLKEIHNEKKRRDFDSKVVMALIKACDKE